MRTDSTRPNSKCVRNVSFPVKSIIKDEISSSFYSSGGQKGQCHRGPLLYQKSEPYLNLRFSKWYLSVDVFSRSTENEPFVQNITVLTYKEQYCIRHQLGAYVTLGIHSLQVKTNGLMNRLQIIFRQNLQATYSYQLASASDITRRPNEPLHKASRVALPETGSRVGDLNHGQDYLVRRTKPLDYRVT